LLFLADFEVLAGRVCRYKVTEHRRFVQLQMLAFRAEFFLERERTLRELQEDLFVAEKPALTSYQLGECLGSHQLILKRVLTRSQQHVAGLNTVHVYFVRGIRTHQLSSRKEHVVNCIARSHVYSQRMVLRLRLYVHNNTDRHISNGVAIALF
jgi:hypothetical protein